MSAVKQSRARLLTCVALLVSGCSGGNDDSSSNPTPESPASGSAPTTPASSAGISVAAALAQLEASGVIPVLNRDDTVAGPDADKNGVRDDIDGYIRALPDAQAQKNALSQSARAIQSSLIANLADAASLLAASNQIANSVACLYTVYGPEAASQKGADIEKLTVNTKVRFDAYLSFNQAINGQVAQIPAGDTCEK